MPHLMKACLYVGSKNSKRWSGRYFDQMHAASTLVLSCKWEYKLLIHSIVLKQMFTIQLIIISIEKSYTNHKNILIK